MLQSFIDDFDEKMKDRAWYWYIPLAFIMIFLFKQMLMNEGHSSIFSGMNLGIHESGHLLLCFKEGFLCSAAGTIFQLLAPLLALFLLFRQREYFGIPFCWLWFASSLFEVTDYISDSQTMALPLVSVDGGDVTHDWNSILNTLGLLKYDTLIGKIVLFLALIVAIDALSLCFYMIYRIRKAQNV